MSNGHRGKRDLTPEAEAPADMPPSLHLMIGDAAQVLRLLAALPYQQRFRVLRLAMYALVRDHAGPDTECMISMRDVPPSFMTDLVNKLAAL